MLLGICNRSSNNERRDGTFLVFVETNSMSMGSLEAKCYQSNVPTEKLINTIRNTEANGHLITIMVVTKLAAICTLYEKFMEASAGVIVAMIDGNALKNRDVATQLQWKPLAYNEHNTTMKPPKHTIILIKLEYIYYNMYNFMKFCYNKDKSSD